MKDKKTISIIIRLLLTAAIWALGLYYVPEEYKHITFATAFMIAGYDAVSEGYELLLKGRPLNRHLVVTLAALIIYLIGKPAPAVLVMWVHLLDELICEKVIDKQDEELPQCLGERGSTHKAVEVFSALFTPAMLVIAILVVSFYPGITGDTMKHALYIAAIVLILSGAETLRKCTEMCYRHGIELLEKTGTHIDGSGKVEDIAKAENLVIVDKDLLVTGKVSVVRIDTQMKEDEFLKKACSLVASGESFFADALLDYYGRDKELNIIRGFRQDGEMDFCGYIGPKEYFVGTKEYLSQQGVETEGLPEDAALHLAAKNSYLGSIVFADETVEGIKDEINNIRNLGIRKVSVVTLDNSCLAQSLMENTGVNEVVKEYDSTPKTLFCTKTETDNEGAVVVADRIATAAEARKAALRTMSKVRSLLVIFVTAEIILLVLALMRIIPCYVADAGVMITTVLMLLITIRE